MEIDDDYDLEVLLELRQQERDEAKKDYARALQRHDELEKEVERLTQKHHEFVEERKRERQRFDDKLAAGPQPLARIQEFNRYIDGLKVREKEALERVEDAEKKKFRAHRKMTRANDAMIEAVRQLKAVEKHYEKWRQKEQIENKRRQSAQMDDIAARMWREHK